jgi:glycosyltransferase involved in cell wall biosynthesis
MRWIPLSIISREKIKNILWRTIRKPYSRLYYVIERVPVDWSIKWDGKYITENLNAQRLLKARSTITQEGIKDQIIHFGSVNTFLTSEGFQIPKKPNKYVLTWFHVMPNHPRIKYAKEAQKFIDSIHTASIITKENLIEIGIPEEKIVVIPLGVDLKLFKPTSLIEKQKIKEKLGIPKDKLVIGSFQKDGLGWGEGLEPKWVKGPDTFVNVVDEMETTFPIFILLLGPARGYIKRELAKRNIPYKHVFLRNYLEIPEYYNTLDLYIVASRVEGGPKAILESMATGVPVISTKVGMAAEIIKEGKNGFLAEIDDVASLSEKASSIIENKSLANKIVNNALDTIKKYSWEEISRKYYEKIYINFLQ